MVYQQHSGLGDNVLGDKYENIIRSIQSRDLSSVIDSIMHDIRYRNLSIAREKLDCLTDISSLETDVCLLLQALSVKLELVEGSKPSSKNGLLKLLQYQNLPNDVKEVVTSILIDFESRTSEELARKRYATSTTDSSYLKEVFFERLASKEELGKSYNSATAYDLSEQEVTGLVRGALRVQDFALAFELARLLDEYFSSSNSRILLLYTESCLLVARNQHNHYVSLSKQEKANADRLIIQLLADIEDKHDNRHVATLTNLLNVTCFLDSRLYGLGQLHIEKIREIDSISAEIIEQFSTGMKTLKTKFELVSDTLDLEQFAHLDFAFEYNLIKVRDVKKWVDKGGAVHTGDNYINSFLDLYLRASVCSVDDQIEVQRLDARAKIFLEQDSTKFIRINPYKIVELCNKFISLNLPLNAVKYLNPFLSDDAWVSPVFECYLNALFASEKFDLFLSKIKHLEPEDKTKPVYLLEAQVYERLNEYDLSIKSTRSAIGIASNNPYAWRLLLHVSRSKGLSIDELKEIVFEIPEAIFSTYDDSKVALVNEIAIYIDTNLAERVLVDWFAQNPAKVAKPLTQIHFNSLANRSKVHCNPYVPIHCEDGVTYSDGFETFTRILVRDVEASHPCLLDLESPLGQVLVDMQQGDKSGNITMLERLPPYVAAFRLAAEIRNKGNDGTDAFKKFSLPANEEEYIPYFKSVLEHYSSKEIKRDDVLLDPNIPLAMRGKFTDPTDPVRAAITHLTSNTSTQYLGLFNLGEESPRKVIIDVYTAVYFSLMGFASTIVRMNLELIVCQYTKKVLESWVENILREDYMSMGVSGKGLYRITSEDIRRDSLGLIQGLQTLLEHVTLEALKPVDTPEVLVKVRNVVDETVYSTFQLSVANDIPLLCIDHLMCELAFRSGCPAANMNSFVTKVLNSLSLQERKKSIQLHLSSGTPVPILYSDILELSGSPESSDTYLVFKFMEKYGKTIAATGSPLSFLTGIVRNVTAIAYIDGAILAGGRTHNPGYDGYAEHVFNYCCRSAMVTLDAESSEQKFAMLIYNVIDTPRRVRKYVELILLLASEFTAGHFLDFDACNESLCACQEDRRQKMQGSIEAG
ncbi:PIN domain-containing protein [Serratia fonticola]|uniref:GapS6b family protein n=1 Tax=Serratia fonticola TaxID=47917 RepID=UPI001ED9010B|nr:hypothetical protein [Serratia fonticola]